MAFEGHEELMRLSRAAQTAFDAYYSALKSSTKLSETHETRAALGDAFAHLQTCWQQKAEEEEIRKHSG